MKKYFILLLFEIVKSECPSGWIENVINKKCYNAFESGKEATWTQAESECQKMGGDLTPLLDESEKNFVYQSVINRRSYDYYWIGLNARIRNQIIIRDD